jgi:hypothetical protein
VIAENGEREMRADWAAASEYTNLHAPARRVPWFNISTDGGLHATSFLSENRFSTLARELSAGKICRPS